MILVYVLTAIVMAFSLLVQSNPAFDVIRIFGVKPDLLFISIIYFGYSFGSFYGEVTGFIGGIFMDSISRSPLGFDTLPKVILGYTVGFFGRSVFHGSILSVIIIIIIASLAKGVISLILAFLFHQAAVTERYYS
jgi:rod shape-determining protein MreD